MIQLLIDALKEFDIASIQKAIHENTIQDKLYYNPHMSYSNHVEF
jgi:hypothetical protein